MKKAVSRISARGFNDHSSISAYNRQTSPKIIIAEIIIGFAGYSDVHI
jgi:hypothetical protein